MYYYYEQLTNHQKRDFTRLVSIAVLLSVTFVGLSFTVKILHLSDKIYVPNRLDYLRTLLLSCITSLIINFTYRYIHKYFIFLKIWLIFSGLLLLALPQRTEFDVSNLSKWNLVKREAFLYGVFYQIVSTFFYIHDQLVIAQNGNEVLMEATDPNNEETLMNESVRQRSTLENCLEIRRKSNHLKKILYPEAFNTNDSSTDADSILKPSLSYDSTNNSPPRIDSPASLHPLDTLPHLPTPGSLISAFYSIDAKNHIIPHGSFQWIIDHGIWIASEFLYEIGLSLILSITFIYVPGLDELKFSFLEKYFYNRVDHFILEVILPLFILLSILHLSEVYVTSRQLSAHRSTKAIVASYWSSIGISTALFVLGMVVS